VGAACAIEYEVRCTRTWGLGLIEYEHREIGSEEGRMQSMEQRAKSALNTHRASPSFRSATPDTSAGGTCTQSEGLVRAGTTDLERGPPWFRMPTLGPPRPRPEGREDIKPQTIAAAAGYHSLDLGVSARSTERGRFLTKAPARHYEPRPEREFVNALLLPFRLNALRPPFRPSTWPAGRFHPGRCPRSAAGGESTPPPGARPHV